MNPFLKEQINSLITEAHSPLPVVDDSGKILPDIESRIALVVTQATKIQAGKDLIRLLRVGQELNGVTNDEFIAVITAANLGELYDPDKHTLK